MTPTESRTDPTPVDDLRRLAEAATPGPWRWAGNVDAAHIELTTRDRGMLYVMRFVRWGMRSAQPMFQPLPIGSHTAMVKATEAPIFEVAPEATERSDPRVYRGDLIGLRHPDAQWIAAADPTTILALLDRLAAAESQRDALRERAERAERFIGSIGPEEWRTIDRLVEARAALASPEEEKPPLDDETRALIEDRYP